MHECLTNAVFKTDIDLRKTLFKDIVLAGVQQYYPGLAIVCSRRFAKRFRTQSATKFRSASLLPRIGNT